MDAKRIRENFKTHAEAIARKQELEIQAINTETAERMLFTRLSPEQLKDAELAFAELGEAPMLAAVRFYKANYRPSLIKKSVREAFAVFMAAKEHEEKCRPDTLRNLNSRVGILNAHCPERLISDILPEHLVELINRPESSAVNQENDRRAMSSFFSWCLERKFCQENPAKRQTRKRPGQIEQEQAAPEVLPLGDVVRLLEAARAYKDGKMIPYTVMALFCAIRPRELSRLTWADIDLEERTATIGSNISKVRGRRIVEISENAIEWLTAHALKQTPIVGPNWRKDFDEVKAMAGYSGRQGPGAEDLKPWPADVLRHTGISYHLALHQNDAKTALWAGNSPSIIHAFYKGLVKAKDAKAFWSIRPDSGSESIIEVAKLQSSVG